jgi:hypothetical protein
MAMKGLPALLADLVDRADVGVAEGGRSLCLAVETGQCLRVSGDFIRQELEGNESV